MHSICILLFVSMNEYMVSWDLMQWQVPWMHQSRAAFCLFSVKQRLHWKMRRISVKKKLQQFWQRANNLELICCEPSPMTYALH